MIVFDFQFMLNLSLYGRCALMFTAVRHLSFVDVDCVDRFSFPRTQNKNKKEGECCRIPIREPSIQMRMVKELSQQFSVAVLTTRIGISAEKQSL